MGKKEYYEEKSKADEKLADALKEIEDAKIDIQKGEKELKDKENEFYASIKDGKEKKYLNQKKNF